MGLAAAPPVRVDLGMYVNDDKLVALLWRRAGDAAMPIPITSAVLTLRFDLPNDDLWPKDPTTGLPVRPTRQIHTITSTTPGDAGGWIDPARLPLGEVNAHIVHTVWASRLRPFSGTWDVVAMSADTVQRVLARGEWHTEEGANAT